MITIALDEQGDFENVRGERETQPVFIGGILYDDKNDLKDCSREKERLKKYFECLCSSVGVSYPRDLHVTADKKNIKKTHDARMKFAETIEEFLKEGTFQKKPLSTTPRQGEYHIFVSLRGKNGKLDLIGKEVSEPIRDDFAGNLYLHMAEDVLERMVFHNPLIDDIQKVRLELPTRKIPVSSDRCDGRKRQEEYSRLGYTPEKDRGGEAAAKWYQLTNSYVFRTAIARDLLKSNKNIHFERIRVEEINYGNEEKGREWLYLADLVCWFLSYDRKSTTPSGWAAEFQERTYAINGTGNKRKNLVWSYDDVDEFFRKSWDCIEARDYYGALSSLFDGMRGTSDKGMVSYYKKTCFPLITEEIGKRIDPESFAEAVRKMESSILANNLNQSKLRFIFSNLDEMGKKVVFPNPKEGARLFSLYNAGVTAYTHLGNSKKAAEYYKKAMKYAQYVPMEEIIRVQNKMVVFLCDEFNFRQALEIANDNVRLHEELTGVKKRIFGESYYASLNHAKTLSQRGQVYAFLGDERAEKDFLEALKYMDDDTPDQRITQSYLLHYYVDRGMKKEYEKVAKSYFGGMSALGKQLRFLIEEGAGKENVRFSLKFALYVYVKALYVFYLDEVPKDLRKSLKDIRAYMEKVNPASLDQMNGHPWEIIYKYLALILLHYGNKEIADAYINRLSGYLALEEGIVRDIAAYGLAVYRNMKKGRKTEQNANFIYMYV